MAIAEHWTVQIHINGEDVLHIGHNHMSGIPDIGQHDDTIRHIAESLLGFVGPVDPEPFAVEDEDRQEMTVPITAEEARKSMGDPADTPEAKAYLEGLYYDIRCAKSRGEPCTYYPLRHLSDAQVNAVESRLKSQWYGVKVSDDGGTIIVRWAP